MRRFDGAIDGGGGGGAGAIATAGAAALVVFRDRTEIAWLRGLKRGFRHCAVWVRAGDFWILQETLSHQTLLGIWPAGNEAGLVAALRASGHRIVPARIAAAPRRIAPPLPFSCVESVKRVLGIHAWSMLTPWQLYRHLAGATKILIDNYPK
ncbi:MAG: hypothetical protein JNL71_03070 [Rhodospirillales bacterium]|nr:hypothetical protein [Rhodospirillales bacterium]